MKIQLILIIIISCLIILGLSVLTYLLFFNKKSVNDENTDDMNDDSHDSDEDSDQGTDDQGTDDSEPKVIDPEVIDPEVIDPEVIDPKVIDPKVIDPKVIDIISSSNLNNAQNIIDNKTTYWSSDKSFNSNTGIYNGNNKLNIKNIGNVKGEYLILKMNYPVVVKKYDIVSSKNSVTNSPNSWYILGSNDDNITSSTLWNKLGVVTTDETDFFDETSVIFKFDYETVNFSIDNNNSYKNYAFLFTKTGTQFTSTSRNYIAISEIKIYYK